MNTNNRINKFKTITVDKIKLQGYYILPTSKPKAIIYYIHGLGGHSMRFRIIAQLLAENNIATFAIDLRGHGISEGKQGYAKNIQTFIKDINSCIEYSKKIISSDTPKFIYGNSMGGIIAIEYYKNNPILFNGIILTAPWFELAIPIPIHKRIFIKLLALILPHYIIKKRGEKYSGSVSNDKLIHYSVGIKLLDNVINYSKTLNKLENKNLIPTIIFHGENDNVTNHKASENFAEKHKPNCTFIKVEKARHGIHLEENNNYLFNILIKWINNIISRD